MERDGTHQKTIITEEDFNSHAHVERDSIAFTVHSCATNFNSHAHVERDPSLGSCNLGSANFNSHAHVERDKAR